ncbi:hypothetical protein QCA50_011649 [Cerrena zonata]|uniref:Uncharacterized protein n=1 Tax=Cerrena zonata TaxID=2478898 RepID=A0AAW0FWK5_9APHY
MSEDEDENVVELSDSESEGKASPAGVLRTENFVESLRNDPHGLPDRGQVHFTEKFEIIEGHPGPSRVQYGPLGWPPDSGRDPSRKGILKNASAAVSTPAIPSPAVSERSGFIQQSPSTRSTTSLRYRTPSPASDRSRSSPPIVGAGTPANLDYTPPISGRTPLGSSPSDSPHPIFPGTPAPPLSHLPIPLGSFPFSDPLPPLVIPPSPQSHTPFIPPYSYNPSTFVPPIIPSLPYSPDSPYIPPRSAYRTRPSWEYPVVGENTSAASAPVRELNWHVFLKTC